MSTIETVVPATLRDACARLSNAGHRAMVTGDGVRAALVGGTGDSWQLATDGPDNEAGDNTAVVGLACPPGRSVLHTIAYDLATAEFLPWPSFDAAREPEAADDWNHTLSFVGAASDPLVRLAALLAFDEQVDPDDAVSTLPLSEADRTLVARLSAIATLWCDLPVEDEQLKDMLDGVGTANAPRVLELLAAQAEAFSDANPADDLRQVIEQIKKL